jgi:hypothetical protein
MKYKTQFLLLLFLIVLSILYGYHKVIQRGPFSYHQWRQADCLAFTLNYYEDDLNFFKPSIQWIGHDGHGRTISEFPILYYSVAQLWKIFGKHEFIFRLLNIIIVFTGLLYLFKLLSGQLKDDFWAMAAVILLFTSPALVFYSNNFLADAPAFGFAMIGAFHLWKYYSNGKTISIWWASLFFLLGGLLKITALLLFIGFVVIHVYNLLLKRNKNFRLSSFIPLGAALVLVLAWNFYVKYYNSQNLGSIFLQGILPIWSLTFAQRRDISISLYHEIMPSFLNMTVLTLLFFSLLYTLLNRDRANRFLLALTVICFSGCVMFMILFYKVFNVHDYYIVNLLIMVPLASLNLLDYIQRNRPDFLQSRSVRILVILGLGFLVYNTMVRTRIRYDDQDYFVSRSFVMDKAAKDYWGWYHWNYENTIKALETIEPTLRQLGVRPQDRVISLPDMTTNMTLYLLDRKGFTGFGGEGNFSEENIRRSIAMGARYLIVNDRSILTEQYLQPFITRKIGTYKTTDIYQLF